ncbi:MAG: Asp-tRNA(Asn)/Glu-tRNA(Gln) amidotransferase subunit GatA [Candidatus Babeliales bacterium]
MNNYAFATIKELRAALEAKKITSQELLDYYIERFKTYDPHVLSALEIFDKQSVLDASAKQGMLAGIPGLIKDTICQKDRIASCSSKILENFVSPYDATAVERLKQQGALLLGRANCDEFAMGSSGETSAFQKTTNPWDKSRVPGGSSSGSAACVAAGLVPWSLGTETGGSVRQPAALCGIVGLKPTYGLVSRYGLIAYGSSLDQIGIFTRTAYDNALVLSAMAGHDTHDSTSLPESPKDYTKDLTGKIKPGLTIGVIDNALHAEGIDPEIVHCIEDAIKVYEKLGATIKRITVPTLDYAAAVYFIISRAEAASNLARFDGVRYGYRDKSAKTLAQMYTQTRQHGFGDEVKARILIGNYVLSSGHADAYYNNAEKVRRLMRKEFADQFKNVDLMLAPVHPAPAFKFGAFDNDKLQMDLQDYFTCAMNLVGIPALAFPCGMSSSKLPIGMQLIGPELSEGLLFQTAHAYEQLTPWHTQHPESFK